MYGKMLVLTFEDNEDDMMSHILSLINTREEIIQMSGLNNHLLNFKGLKIDEVQRVIIRENQEIELTYTEFEIFKLLAKHPGIVFSKEQIYDIVWKESYSGDYNIVMSHVRNIREKIEDKLAEYKPLAKVEELTEQNYNMIDNVLNNGAEKKEQEQTKGRISIKEKLAEKKAVIEQRDKAERTSPEKETEKKSQREM